MRSRTLITVLCALASTSPAFGQLPDGYVEVPMTWDFAFEAETVPMNGTIEHALSEMRAMKPHLEVHELVSALNTARPNSPPPASSKTLICDKGAKFYARPDKLEEGIDYLSQIRGACRMPAGKSCSRISCSWKAAIWLCNDSDEEISPACSSLCGYVAKIIEKCPRNYAGQVMGMNLAPYGFHIVAGGDYC